MAFYITQVRTVQPTGYTHPHISQVRLSDGTVETRAQVISYILNYGMTYLSHAPGVPDAKVIVRACPVCGSHDYITTEPDWTPDNNLLSLPRF